MFTLNTSRLILRDLLEDDWPVLHRLRSNPTVTQYIDYIISKTEDESRQWVLDTMVHNAKEPRSSYNLTITRQSDQQILGWIGIGDASEPELGDMDFAYALLPEFWGKGYASEALRAMIDLVFTLPNVARVYGECDGPNLASARVMQKAGMRLVARIGEKDEETGKLVEELRYEISASENKGENQ